MRLLEWTIIFRASAEGQTDPTLNKRSTFG